PHPCIGANDRALRMSMSSVPCTTSFLRPATGLLLSMIERTWPATVTPVKVTTRTSTSSRPIAAATRRGPQRLVAAPDAGRQQQRVGDRRDLLRFAPPPLQRRQ